MLKMLHYVTWPINSDYYSNSQASDGLTRFGENLNIFYPQKIYILLT